VREPRSGDVNLNVNNLEIGKQQKQNKKKNNPYFKLLYLFSFFAHVKFEIDFQQF
jgi:hypothetical protein